MAEITTIEINTAPAKKSINDIEQELQETNKALKQVDVNSKAFSELQKKAAGLKGELDQVNKTTDALSKGFQGWGENLAKVTSGISGGITAVTAGMQLLGVENENVVAGIAKLQQLMAFTQGISSLKDLGEGFKVLKGAINATSGSLKGVKGALIGTGIGAFVVLLGEMIANWDKITAAIDDFIGSAGDASRVTAGMDAAFTAIKTTIVAVGQSILDFVITPFKTVINSIKAFSETNGSLLDKLKAASSAAKDNIVDTWDRTKTNFKKIGTDTAAAYNESIDRQNKEAEDKREAERQKARQKAIEDAKKHAAQIAKAQQDAYNKYLKDNEYLQAFLQYQSGQTEDTYTQLNFLQQQIALQEELLNKMKEAGNEKTIAYLNELKQLDDLKAAYDSLADSMEPPTEEGTTDNSQEYLDMLQQQLDNLQLLGESRYYMLEQQYANEQALLDESLANNLLSEAEYAEKSKQIQKKKAAAWLDVGVQIANGLSDILSAFADNEEQNSRESFERSKKLQISIATIQMLTGIVTALSGAMTNKLSIADWILAGTQAATIATAGAVNIAKIARQKYDSGSSTSVSTGALSNTIIPPTQYTNAVQNANIESKLEDQRVYIVESDIQNASNRVSVQENENVY